MLLVLWPAQQGRSADEASTAPVDPSIRTQPGVPPLENVPLGQQLPVEYQCGSCHRIEGVGSARGRRGPALVQLGRRSDVAGLLPDTPLQLANRIVDPVSKVRGTARLRRA